MKSTVGTQIWQIPGRLHIKLLGNTNLENCFPTKMQAKLQTGNLKTHETHCLEVKSLAALHYHKALGNVSFDIYLQFVTFGAVPGMD